MAASIYSQGFNFGSFIEKGVDPRTGQYTCSIDLYEVPAKVRNCPPFKLTLKYNPVNTLNTGLGNGWSFNLPSYQQRQSPKTAVLSTGESYRVNETSTSLFVLDQKLLSSKITKLPSGGYQFTYKSGQIEILSNFNDTYNKSVPVELYSHVGRSLTFGYIRSGEEPRLETIKQGSDVLIQVKYGFGQTEVIRAPGTSEEATFTLVQRNDQLVEIKRPLPDSTGWKFVYQNIGQMSYPNHVTSPSGFVEEISYKADGHRLPTGAPRSNIPYAIAHTAHPGAGQPAVKTYYSFSDHNFLAYGSTQSWRGGEDNLFLTADDYQYSSTVQVEGGARTSYTYNKFHLLVTSTQQTGMKQTTQTTTYHAQPYTPFDRQPAQYQLPKTVQTTYRDMARNTYRTEESSHTFDEWGNPLHDVQVNGIKTDRTYYSAAGESGCPADPHGFQRYIKTETITPANSASSAPTRKESYSYSQIPCSAGGKVSYFVTVQKRETVAEGRTQASTDYTYENQTTGRDHGRVQQEKTYVSGKHACTKVSAYALPSSDRFQEVVTTTGFDNLTTTTRTTSSTISGLATTHQDEAGINENFFYDAIGRLIKTISAPGTSYESEVRTEYSIVGNNNGYLEKVIDANGLQTCSFTDGFERLCRVEKQSTSGGPLRETQTITYNSRGQQISTANIDWFAVVGSQQPAQRRETKSYEYDDWGNVYKTTSSSGLVSVTNSDPIGQTKTESIEGEGSIETKLNIFGAPSEITLRKSNNTIYSKVTFGYDGLGRLVSQRDHLGRTKEYHYDPFDRVVETNWPEGRTVKSSYASHTTAALPVSTESNGVTMGAQSFDGIGRLTQRTIASRKMAQFYEGTSPEPSVVTHPSGDTVRLNYAPALGFAPTSVAHSGDSDYLQYSPRTGVMSQSKNSSFTQDLEYTTSGQLSRETFKLGDGQTLRTTHSYSMAGKLQEYTDVHGYKHEVSYDSFARPQILIQGEIKVSLGYDKAGRVSTSTQEDQATGAKLVTSITYDDFGREIKRSVRKSDNTSVFDLSKTYNELGLVTRRVQQNGQATLRDETFEYDVHNRLVHYKCQGTQVPVDHKGHAIAEQIFTLDKYDNITKLQTYFQGGGSNIEVHSFSTRDPTQLIQVTNTHPDFTSRIELTYNTNGSLTQDEQGRKIEYDGMGRLKAIRRSDGTLLANYLYDGSGRLICQQIPNQPDNYLFYREDSIIAVKKGTQTTSYLSNGDEYWGETVSGAEGKKSYLWALDDQQSVLATLDGRNSGQIRHQQYTPYCSSRLDTSHSSIAFNGQWRDPVTGWYHLGNGYRVYNPVLMRFHTPDSWSPFTSGEINPYAYCLADPINRADPSGHFSLFGKRINLGWKDLIMTVVGIAASVAVGVLTGGASLAIQIGIGIAVGVAVEVAGGMIDNAIKGNPITWTSVGMDALSGLVGGLAGAAGGSAVKAGMKAVVKSGTYHLVQPGLKQIAMSGVRGAVREVVPGFVGGQIPGLIKTSISMSSSANSAGSTGAAGAASSAPSTNQAAQMDNTAVLTNPLGRIGPPQAGIPDFYIGRSAPRARNLTRPVLKDGSTTLSGVKFSSKTHTPFSNYSLGGVDIAELLNRHLRTSFIAPAMSELIRGQD